jgi:hypothetical protein
MKTLKLEDMGIFVMTLEFCNTMSHGQLPSHKPVSFSTVFSSKFV